MTDFDIAIIGGGVIGLAVARALACTSAQTNHTRQRIVVLEQESRLGTGSSSRNSEVIHSGIYYPKSYLKSTLCVRGREQLYQYCREHNIAHQKIGKLIVANSDAEHEFLHALALRAEFNGVKDLRWLTAQQIQELEPAVRAQAALLTPSTGIIDSAALLRSLEKDCVEAGVDIALNTRVTRMTPEVNRFRIHCNDGTTFTARHVVNSAGLHAVNMARAIEGFPSAQLPEIGFAKGCYFSYSGKNPFRHLIYPVPAGQSMAVPAAQHNSLGIHATQNIHGQLHFGPDLEMVTHENYTVSADKRDAFVVAIQRYFPTLNPALLQPAYAGIRPRIIPADANTKKIPDFIIQTQAQHGITGLINLFGIESPGLTSCLALAETVALHLTE